MHELVARYPEFFNALEEITAEDPAIAQRGRHGVLCHFSNFVPRFRSRVLRGNATPRDFVVLLTIPLAHIVSERAVSTTTADNARLADACCAA